MMFKRKIIHHSSRITLLVVVIFIEIVQSLEDTCIFQYKKCLSDNSACSGQVSDVQKYCGDYREVMSLRGCYPEKMEKCKESLSNLFSNYSSIRSCTCTSFDLSMDEIGECNQILQYLHDHPCRRNPPLFHTKPKPVKKKTEELFPINISQKDIPKKSRFIQRPRQTFNPIRQDMSLRSLIKTFQIPNRVISSTSCSQIIDYCLNNLQCNQIYQEYSQYCSSENLDNNQVKCRLLKKDVQKYGLSQSCTCSDQDVPSAYSKCLAHQNYFLDNQPLAVLENQDRYSYMDAASQTKLKELNNQSCLRNSQKCASSDRCLSYLLSEEKCEGKMREFLSWPDSDSYLPICTCDRYSGNLRKDCNLMKNLIQPDCSTPNTIQRHCVASIRDCLNNPDCRNVYLEYSHYCLKDTQGQCFEENFEKCYEAKRILLASNALPKECSCTAFYSLEVPGKNQYEPLQLDSKQEAICTRFNNALHDSECFQTDPLEIPKLEGNKRSLSVYDFQADQTHYSDESRVCKLAEDYDFKKHSVLRVYNGSDYKGNSGQNFCSKICKCNIGCQGIPCKDKINAAPTIKLCNEYAIFQINSNEYICDDNQLWSNRPNIQGKEIDLLVSFNLYELELVTNASSTLHHNPRTKMSLEETSIELLENEINSILIMHQKDSIDCQFSLKDIQPKFNVKNWYTAKFEMIVKNNRFQYCKDLGELFRKMMAQEYLRRYPPFVSILDSIRLEEFINDKQVRNSPLIYANTSGAILTHVGHLVYLGLLLLSLV